MAEFTEEQVKERVRAKVVAGDFFFPEDLARAIAKQLGVELEGTPMAPVAPADSPTRGDVPPFSGRPFSDEHATEHAKAAVKAYDEARKDGAETETTTTRTPRPTKEEVFGEAGDPLEGAPDAAEAAESEQDVRPEGNVETEGTLSATDASGDVNANAGGEPVVHDPNNPPPASDTSGGGTGSTDTY